MRKYYQLSAGGFFPISEEVAESGGKRGVENFALAIVEGEKMRIETISDDVLEWKDSSLPQRLAWNLSRCLEVGLEQCAREGYRVAISLMNRIRK